MRGPHPVLPRFTRTVNTWVPEKIPVPKVGATLNPKKDTFDKLELFAKALFPMLVTLRGNVRLSEELKRLFAKALAPMVVIPEGRVKEVKRLFAKALS